MSQPALAEIGRVTMRSQRNYEKDERSPDAIYLAAIAAAGADVRYILTGLRDTPLPAPLAPEEAALLDNYRHSPEVGRQAIKATSAALAQRGMNKKGNAA